MKALIPIFWLFLSLSVFAQTPISQPLGTSGVPAMNSSSSIFDSSQTFLINIDEFIQGEGNDLSPTYVNNLTGKSNSIVYAKKFTDNKFDIKVSPNPTFDWITFEVQDKDFGNYTFQLIDVSGDVVVEFRELSVQKVMFNTHFIHSGTYLVRFEQEATLDWSMYKIVKANSQ